MNRLHAVLQPGNDEISQVTTYLMQTRGKLLRPRLVYLCASFYPHDPAAVCDTAVAVELIHMASLVHDDVIDHSALRRGQQSLNVRFGEKISVLTGDFLFASAFQLIGQMGSSRIMEDLSSTIKIMCGGEIRQLNQAYNTGLSQEDYFDKSFAKTACLFACACRVGAMVSEMPSEQANLLEKYGLCLGYAYQIIDDVLDYVGDSNELGKPVGGDLLDGNVTLPILLALEDPKYSARMQNLLREGEVLVEDLPRIIQVLKESGSLDNSLRWAKAFIRQGLDSLAGLPDMDVRLELRELAYFLLAKYNPQHDSNQVHNMEA